MGEWKEADLSIFIHNIYNNTVNGKPLLYYKNENNIILNGIEVGQIILVNCSNFEIRNINIKNTDVAIQIAHCDDVNISHCNITSNNYFGIWHHYSSCNQIHYCNIYNNTNYGVYNYNSDPEYKVDASYNWWGSADGPSVAGPGSGDAVSSNVIYEPWLTEPWEGENPILYVHPISHDFGNMDVGEEADWNFYIENKGGGTLSWSISESLSWASVSSTSGTTTTEIDEITVHVDTTGLEAGKHYDGYIYITSNGGNEEVYIELDTNELQQKPFADFTWYPSSPELGNQIYLDASASYDPDGGSIVKYEWDLNNDGIIDEEKANDYLLLYVINETDFNIKLRVTDDEGQTSEVTKTIEIPDTATHHVLVVPTYYEEQENHKEYIIENIKSQLKYKLYKIIDYYKKESFNKVNLSFIFHNAIKLESFYNYYKGEEIYSPHKNMQMMFYPQ